MTKRNELHERLEEIDRLKLKYKKASQLTAEIIADKTAKLTLDAKIRETLRLLKELQMLEKLQKDAKEVTLQLKK